MKGRITLKDLAKFPTKQKKGKKGESRVSRSMGQKRGKTLTSKMKQLEKQRREMKDKNRWEFLRNQCILQQSDWFKSNLYQSFLKNGRHIL
jgi:hypothetical protein